MKDTNINLKFPVLPKEASYPPVVSMDEYVYFVDQMWAMFPKQMAIHQEKSRPVDVPFRLPKKTSSSPWKHSKQK